MMLWVRARRIPQLTLLLVALALLLRLGRGHFLVIPTVLGGGAAAMTWSTLLPLLWAAALCACFDAAGREVEQRPLRNLGALDTLLFCGATAAFALVTILMDNGSAWIQVLAHASALGGLATAVTVVWGSGAGVMAATTTVVVTSSYSPHLAAGPYVRFLQPEGDPVFALLAGLMLAAWAVGTLSGQRRPVLGVTTQH